MSLWMLLLGAALLVLVAYDVGVTTISTTSAAGPVTARLGRTWWAVAHRLSRRPSSVWLSSAGPLILLGTIFAWLLLLWTGWYLVLAADPSAVVSAMGHAPADWSGRMYFTGFTIFTLGVGDYVPAGAPWQLLTVVASVSGLAITTASITYLIPVVTAATQRAQLASRIAVLGRGPYDMVVHTYEDGSVQYLETMLSELTNRLLQLGEQHLAYPILHYFHPRSAQTELRVQLAAFDDALTLAQHGLAHDVVRPHPAAVAATRAAMGHLLEQAGTADAERAPELGLGPLRDAGLPTVSDGQFQRALSVLEDHRQRMAAYAAESRWPRMLEEEQHS